MTLQERPTSGSTRQRILDIALDLFIEHGYDKTSVREIAEHLGSTKAALYHHFASKQELLRTLHRRFDQLEEDLIVQLGELEAGDDRAEALTGLIDQLIDQMVTHRKLFLLHDRNRNAFEHLARGDHDHGEPSDVSQRIRHYLSRSTLPLAERVQAACAIGAVTTALLAVGDAFADVPTAELAEAVRRQCAPLLRPCR